MRSFAVRWGRLAVAAFTLASGATSCEVESDEYDVSAVCRGGTISTAEDLAVYQLCGRITGQLSIIPGGLSSVSLPNLGEAGEIMVEGKLETLDLPNLRTVRNISVDEVDELRLPALKHVQGFVYLHAASFELAELVLVDESFHLDAWALTTVELPKLRQAGSLGLSGPFTGLHAPLLEVLDFRDRGRSGLGIEDTKLTLLSLPALRKVDGQFFVSSNPELEVLEMPRLGYARERVEISDNRRLPTCMAQQLADQLVRAGYDGPLVVADNDDTAPCPLP